MTTSTDTSAPETQRTGPGTGGGATTGVTRRPRRRRRFTVVAVVAVLAVLGGAVAPWAYDTFVNTSAKDRIEADPPPTLFSDSAIRPIEHRVDAQPARARRLMADWWQQHGSTADDAAFVSWLEQTLPKPPSPARRAKEIKQVQAIDRTRTSAGVAAATWLEAYGKNDVWQLAAHDQAEMLPGTAGDALKNHVDDAMKMAKDVADTLGTRDQQSAPYVVDPSLRTDKTVNPGDVCPCSYPSSHAAEGGAATTYLMQTDRTGLGLPVDAGRDHLVARLHGRARAQRHHGGCPARRHDRGVLPGHPRRDARPEGLSRLSRRPARPPTRTSRPRWRGGRPCPRGARGRTSGRARAARSGR